MDNVASTWQWSRYVRVHERDGLVAVVHLLHPQPVFMTKDIWLEYQTSQTLRAEIEHELRTRQLTVSDAAVDEQALVSARQSAERRLNRPTILYLMMNQGCNWACRGCPIPGLALAYGNTPLTFENVKAGIEVWKNHLAEWPSDGEAHYVILYGGEPLLNRLVVEQSVAELRSQIDTGQLPARTELMLCTNGELIDAQLARFMTDHQVTVAVGLDGPAALNDTTRVTEAGRGTFSQIIATLGRLQEAGTAVVVSLTMTPENLPFIPDFRSRLIDLEVRGFGCNLLKGGGLDALSPEERDAYHRHAAQVVVSMGLSSVNDQLPEYQFGKHRAALVDGDPYPVGCTCLGNQLVVNANGQVSNCPFARVDQGHVQSLPSEFRINRTDTVRHWRARQPIMSSDIVTPGGPMWLDAGGCAWNASVLTGNVLAPDHGATRFTQEVMNATLWSILPPDEAASLRSGTTDHWSDRRVRDVPSPRLRTSRTDRR